MCITLLNEDRENLFYETLELINAAVHMSPDERENFIIQMKLRAGSSQTAIEFVDIVEDMIRTKLEEN